MSNMLKISEGLSEAQEVAEKLSKEQEKIKNILSEALLKAERQKQRILQFWGDLLLLIQMVRAYFSKEYTRTPWKSIIFALAAIIYFLNPFDMIPDVAPALGFLDDATVIAFVVNAIKEDIEAYKKFLGKNTSKVDSKA